MEKNSTILNKHESLEQMRSISYFSRIGLYISQAALVVGFLLVFFDYFGVFSDGVMIWSYRAIDIWIICLGFVITFGCVPYLYFSSLIKFKKGDPFWDVETFWIFILFMVGMFFQYGSGKEYSMQLAAISILTIFFLHSYFMIISHKIKSKSFDEIYHKTYFEGMKYLIVYYVLTLAMFGMFNPLDIIHMTFPIR